MASSSAGDAAAASLVHVAFKHTDAATHFVAATASSLHVFACEPLLDRVLDIRVTADGEGSEVTRAEMRTPSELVLVTRKPNAVDGSVRDHAVHFWSELRGKRMGGKVVRSSCGDVLAVRQLGDYTLVAGEDRAVLYVNNDREKEVATGPNPLGLCALARPAADGSQATSTLMYALPRPERCAVQLRRRGRAGSVNLHAHASGLACLALSVDGRLLATAGSRGTLVRIFDTITGKMLQELRRGSDRASIHCIVFSPDSKWLAVSSDKGTVHVFGVSVDLTSSLPDDDDDAGDHGLFRIVPPSPAPAAKPNQQSSSSTFSFLEAYLPGYLSSERSLAQLRGLRQGTRHEVAFGQDPNTVLVVGMDGSFRRCVFNPAQGGDMVVLHHCNFMDLKR